MAGFDPDAYLQQEQASGGGFDPDSYLASEKKAAFENNARIVSEKPKKSVASSALVGARQGALMGYAPQIEAALEPITAKLFDAINNTKMAEELPEYVERRDKAAQRMQEYKKDNPTAFATGEIGGAVASSVVPAGIASKAVGGLGKVQKLSTAGQNIAKAAGSGAAIGALQNPGDVEGELNPLQLFDRSINAAIGAATGAATQGVVEGGAAILNSGKALIKKGAEVVKENLPKLKPNAPEIIEAARRQGVKITPSMILEGDKFTALEASLAKSPSLFNRVGKRVSEAKQAVENKVDDVLEESSGLSAFETGDKVKKSIQQTFNDKVKPLSDKFEEIASHTKNIGVSDKGVKRVAQNIGKLDEVQLTQGTGLGVANKAEQYTKMLGNVKTVDQLKKVGTMLNQELEAAQGPERQVLGAILDKVRRLEGRNVERAALEVARTKPEGRKLAEGLLSDLKSARTGWRETSNAAKELADQVGVRAKNVRGLNQALDDMRPEDITKRFFNTGDESLLTFMQQKFPKEFDDLRRFKLSEIQGKSKSIASGDSMPGTFIKQINSLSPQVRKMVLGSDKKITDAKDVETLYQAMNQYRSFNPSGTGQANSFTDYFINTLKDVPRAAMLNGMANDTIRNNLNRAVNAASKIKDVTPTEKIGSLAGRAVSAGSDFAENPALRDPRLIEFVSQNPQMLEQVQDPNLKRMIQDRMPQAEPKKYKGESAWISNGYKNLLENDTTGLLQNEAVVQDLMNSKDGAELLMFASEVKPGSRAMESIMNKIKQKYQGAK